MDRYIDAEKLIDEMLAAGNTNSARDAAYFVNKAPTEDVAPVVHGEWKTEDYGIVTCSSCGEFQMCYFDDEKGNRCLLKFCPECGAKMKEVEDG